MTIHKRILKTVFISMVLCLLLSATLLAQQTDNGSLNGLVSDQNGAVVPGATVAAKSLDTGLVRSTKSDNEGRWTLAALKLGNYEVKVEATGFAPVVQNTQVSASTTTAVDTTLGVVGIGEQVEVKADDQSSIIGDGSGGTPTSTFSVSRSSGHLFRYVIH